MKIIGPATDADLPQSPLTPEDPIATLLGKIPGVGSFLKGVQKQTSPQGLMGPGVIAQIMAALQQKATGQGSPQDFYNKTIGPTEQIAGTVGALEMPGATLLQRILSGSTLPAIEHTIHHGAQDPLGFLLKAAGGAATQLGTEGLLRAIKQPFMHRAANQATAAHTKALEDQAARATAAETAHGVAQTVHAGEAATKVMDEIKKVVPAYKDLPSDTAGLTEVVLGEGPNLLSKEFDKYMEAVTGLAGRERIKLPIKDIRSLKLPEVGPNLPGANDQIMGETLAKDAAEAVLGTGAKDWQRYRRVVQALDEAGLGDAEARNAYKTGMGIRDFLGKSKSIEILPEGSAIHTDRILKALSDPKFVDMLRRRGMGTGTTGIMQPFRGGPAAPTPEEPIPPPEILGTDLGNRWLRTKLGMAAGAGAGLATGTGGSHFYGGPALVGGAIGAALPNRWITQAPGTEGLQELIARLGQLGGAGARETTTIPLLENLMTPTPAAQEQE